MHKNDIYMHTCDVWVQYQYVPSLKFTVSKTHTHHIDVLVQSCIVNTPSSIFITERFIGSIRLREMLIYILFFIIPNIESNWRTYPVYYSRSFPMTAWSLHVCMGNKLFDFSIVCMRWDDFFSSIISLSLSLFSASFLSPLVFFLLLPIRECVIYLNNVDVCASICFKYFSHTISQHLAIVMCFVFVNLFYNYIPIQNLLVQLRRLKFGSTVFELIIIKFKLQSLIIIDQIWIWFLLFFLRYNWHCAMNHRWI